VDKLFGHLLAPRSERASTETAAEAFDAGKSDAHYFAGIAIEYRRAGSSDDSFHFIFLAGFVFVIAKHGERRNL
jgi:hypothetical protein